MRTRLYTFIRNLFVVFAFCATASAQDRVVHAESFPNTFNSSFQPITTSNTFGGDMGTWTAASDGTSGKWATIVVNNAHPLSVPNALKIVNYGGNGSARTSTAISPSLNLTSTSSDASVRLRFWLYRFELVNNADFTLHFDISGDAGVNWATLYSKTASTILTEMGGLSSTTDPNNGHDSTSFAIPVSMRTANFRFRIRGEHRSSNVGNAFLYIDDINIVANTCGLPATQIPRFNGAAVTQTQGSVNGVFNVGDVFKFPSVITTPNVIDAFVQVEAISNAVLESIDDETAGVGAPERFQPRIAPRAADGNNTVAVSQEGWVQFTITFRRTQADNNGQLANISNLNFRHFDLDGFTNGTGGYFSEASWVTGVSNTFLNNPTSLTNAGTVAENNFTWRKIIGDDAERDQVSVDPTTFFTTTYNGANVVRFRMGYKLVIGTGGSAITLGARQYSAEFGCYDLSTDISLPVTLVSFNGSLNNNAASLIWQTASESNIKHYEVERMVNGAFRTVGVVSSNASSNANTYRFSDDLSAEAGQAFTYRLRIAEHDGKVSYSRSITLKRGGTTAASLKVVPNPITVGQAVVLQVMGEVNAQAQVALISSTGATIMTQRIMVQKGYNVLALQLPSSLPAGTYVVRMDVGGNIMTSRLSVQ